VNDRPDVALAAGAAGVHLGPDDLPVALARRVCPPGFIIGASVGALNEADAAVEADYWGIGPWRATETKGDAGEALGSEDFRRLVELGGGKPCIAIGAVRPEDVARVLEAGGAGVAVVSGILGAEEVERATRKYAEVSR
jgi:thiamine-phosphate diphosphorylase